MTVATPADQQARQRIIDDHGTTLFVEAGAGSGKTSSLVGRFVALVLDDVDAASIAAITFTEAAAAELRARVREALEDIVAGTAVRDVTVDENSPDRARRALADLDRAAISTLHSFAQRILTSAPVEADLPPKVEIHDEVTSALESSARWARFERQLLESDDLEVTMRTALVLDIDTDKMRAVAASLDQNWDLIESVDLSKSLAHRADPAIDLSVFTKNYGEIFELAEACPDPEDKLCLLIQGKMRDDSTRIDAAEHNPFTLLSMAKKDLKPPGRSGKAANWPGGGKDRIAELFQEASDNLTAQVERITDDTLACLGGHLAQYTLDRAKERQRSGRLEFHDLLVLARRVLRERHSVRSRLHEQYRHLLIDEFQDTDPIQVELAVRIAADPAHDTSTPWSEVPIEPGRLFFVGDPKQSIYRFRRADIDIFVRTGEIHSDGTTVLNTNFRTVAPIVDVCNQVFSNLITHKTAISEIDGRVAIAQPDYEPLAAYRKALDDDPGPAVVFFGSAQKANADPIRTAEAADAAAVLSRAKAERWLVRPDLDEPPRPCDWSDMAVLIPSRSSLPHLRTAFDHADIPYRLETGSLIYATTEVRDLVSALRAVDDPGDEISIVGALRSPAYGCGDDDLMRWKRAGHRFSYLGAVPEPEGIVGRALLDLQSRHRQRPFESVSQIAEQFIIQRRLFETGLTATRHRDAWRIYRVFIEHARQFADNSAAGLRDFLAWVELQADDKLRATVPVLPEADVNAVRILTIHGSKGLEFGITVVSGMSSQYPGSGTRPTVRFRSDGTFDVKVRSGVKTSEFDAHAVVEDLMDTHERRRLLYVGLTRARDHLAVSVHRTIRENKSHAKTLYSAFDDIDEEWAHGFGRFGAIEHLEGTIIDDQSDADLDEADADANDIALQTATGPEQPRSDRTTPTADDWGKATEAWQHRRSELIERGRAAGSVSATKIASTLAGMADEDGDAPEPEQEPWRRGRGGTGIGSAVHAVLQHADLADPESEDVARLAEWQAQVEGVPDGANDIAAKARAALRSDFIQQAVANGRVFREVHVGAVVNAEHDQLLEGFIDLLIENADGTLTVVDYKTDAVRGPADVAARLARYTPQGAAYAVAVEQATGKTVRDVAFLFVRNDEALVEFVDDLPAHVDRVREALATIQ